MKAQQLSLQMTSDPVGELAILCGALTRQGKEDKQAG
jgi:hypothetical protein